MVNQLVNEFYTQSLLKVDALPQDVGLPFYIATTLLNNFIPDVREFFITEGVQVTQTITTETNHQGNQRLILVRNAEAESEKDTTEITSEVKPESGSLHPRKFM